ncbi:NADH dehydrogenase [ubiquinone] 1 alpha subcomplex assembly factor 3 [Tolypocladium ophioglossoides CBS 100239]|uniref:NADH dehydrogenase [ubiquinone] 1 alpha subcomplex assembly factor 3 n=1 Tax=Tolypocladium ophioglossoides (strain CBS 100239) TaxID=1163406 RepID=A0A0L0NAN0_TOLOC|nr:NADH dehydrogenase [ubiquinone] 1 alpha subcomplex assembly factor 3 [Tolypocladium ophioglossoides CBS 100239]
MRCFTRQCSGLRSLRAAVRSDAARLQEPATSNTFTPQASLLSRPSFPIRYCPRMIHTTPAWRSRKEAPREPQPTDLNELNVLGNVPAPSTSVDVCMYDGFGLNSGVTISDGNGALLVNGEAFAWRPWETKGAMELVNKKGQIELPAEAFGLFDLLWPRPDLLVIGVGKHNLPLSPQTRRHISELGLRVEVLDTRNAAAQFNLLATERGVSEVAAALIPIGWKEGVGAA